MRSLLRKLGKVLRLVALAALVVSIIRAAIGKKRSEVTGEASWPPLADDPKPAPARAEPATPTATVATAPAPEPATGTADAGETTPEPATGTADAGETTPDHDTGQAWVEPVDGACPASHPIKGNAQSNIFHVPGGLSYGRTKAERCYATAEAAEADGFRQARR